MKRWSDDSLTTLSTIQRSVGFKLENIRKNLVNKTTILFTLKLGVFDKNGRKRNEGRNFKAPHRTGLALV